MSTSLRPDVPLLIASYRIAWREWKVLAPLFLGFALLTDGIETLGGMGTLYRAMHGLDPSPLDTAVSGSANLGGSLVALVILVFLLPVELVWFLALMRRIRGGAVPSILDFLRERYRAAFRGFWKGFGWFLLMSLGVGLVVAILLLGLRGSLGVLGNGVLGLIAAGGIFGIGAFLLPYVFATYRCILDAPISFDAAFALAKEDVRGQRSRIVLTLALAFLPGVAVALLPVPASVAGALFTLLGGTLLSIPGSVSTYLFHERFERHSTNDTPYAA